MEEQLYKKFVIISSIFGIFAIVAVVLFMFGQTGMERVSAIAKENAVKRELKAEEQAKKRTEEVNSNLIIPLPKEVKETDVTVEDIYMEQTVKVTITGIWSTFFEQKRPKGSQEFVDAVYYDVTDNTTQIYIALNELCEHQVKFTENEMQFAFTPACELYDKIVAIDAGHGGESSGNSAYGMCEKDITLSIVNQLKELFEQTEIKVYYTRTDDVNPSLEERAGLANASEADLFISIHVNADESTRTTTGVSTTYSRGDTKGTLTSQKLAELLQKEVVAKTEADDKGTVLLQGENELLSDIHVPAAMIEIGYLTNKQEAIRMASEVYKEHVAEGIYEAVLDAFETAGKETGTEIEKEPEKVSVEDEQ